MRRLADSHHILPRAPDSATGHQRWCASSHTMDDVEAKMYSSHLASCPCGSLKFNSQASEPWSVRMVNSRPNKWFRNSQTDDGQQLPMGDTISLLLLVQFLGRVSDNFLVAPLHLLEYTTDSQVLKRRHRGRSPHSQGEMQEPAQNKEPPSAWGKILQRHRSTWSPRPCLLIPWGERQWRWTLRWTCSNSCAVRAIAASHVGCGDASIPLCTR